MQVIEAIKEYCHRQALPVPQEQQGVLVEILLDDQRVSLDYRPDVGALFLRAPLPIPDLEQPELAALYRRLLGANLLGLALNGAYFAIDEDDESVELQYRLEARAVGSLAAVENALALLYGACRRAFDEILPESSPRPAPAMPSGFQPV